MGLITILTVKLTVPNPFVGSSLARHVKFVGRIMSAWKYKKEAARTAGICRRALEDASHGFVKK